MGGDEETTSENGQGSEENSIGGIVNLFYDNLVELGYNYNDLYDMTLKELERTLINRRKGLAYEIWRMASLTRSPFTKNFPQTPKDACPELFPVQKGIKMPDFLIEKAIKRGVL